MQRLISFLLILLLSGAAGCKRQPKTADLEATEEETQALFSVVHVADARASLQLVKGFHDVEQNAWRWTMQKFAVTLKPPAGASQRGATLQLKFVVPEPVIDRLKSVTLSANAEGTALASETYSKPGDYVFTRDVPASALGGDAVAIDFALDKVLPPSPSDQRELGVIVSSIGLEPK